MCNVIVREAEQNFSLSITLGTRVDIAIRHRHWVDFPGCRDCAFGLLRSIGEFDRPQYASLTKRERIYRRQPERGLLLVSGA